MIVGFIPKEVTSDFIEIRGCLPREGETLHSMSWEGFKVRLDKYSSPSLR